ncbi:MAG: hypothetical protein WCD42_10510 [Rhizomicrobium sp.]
MFGKMFSVIAGAILLVTSAQAQDVSVVKPADNPALQAFLKQYFSSRHPARISTPSGVVRAVYLHPGDKPEIIIYITEQSFCGTSGCSMLVLEPQGDSYRMVSRHTIIQTPVMVLPSVTNGWHDLTVFVSGGGVVPGTALLKFNGTKYPGVSSIPEKKLLKKAPTGREIISRDAWNMAAPLY